MLDDNKKLKEMKEDQKRLIVATIASPTTS